MSAYNQENERDHEKKKYLQWNRCAPIRVSYKWMPIPQQTRKEEKKTSPEKKRKNFKRREKKNKRNQSTEHNINRPSIESILPAVQPIPGRPSQQPAESKFIPLFSFIRCKHFLSVTAPWINYLFKRKI